MMRDFQTIQNTTYDLIIIGGGVNGAGTARDAALRGLKTLLIEKGDFASGSSSWSTRLVHGGLRYLEYFEFSLVQESLHERETLLRTAPHLVYPLLLTIPIYGDRSRPFWKIWAGMILYDIFSAAKTMPIHRMLSRQKFRQIFRYIDSDGLNGGAQYYDAQVMRAERLCLENILSAQAAGATALNYVQVTDIKLNDEKISQLHCEDQLTGEAFTVNCGPNTLVVNTSGPWVDKVCKAAEPRPLTKTRKIGGTKGSHIVVKNLPGAPKSGFYVEAKSDGRPFFIVPWLGMYLIGTTDLPFNGDLDRVKADDDEIDYLIRETNLIIPAAQLTREDIVFTYSGVRPLPYQPDKKSAGSITRRHILFDHSKENVKNLVSLIGGKLTTYRHVGEELVDWAFKKWGKTVPACPTLTEPLPGSIVPSDRRFQDIMATYRDRLPGETLYYLLGIYGAQTAELLALVDEYPDLAQPISEQTIDIKAQIVYAMRYEQAHNFMDIALRRTTLAMQGNYALNLLPVFRQLMQEYCGWSKEQGDQATQQYIDYVRKHNIPDYEMLTELATAA